jgi:hypothetical protein
MLHHMSAKPQEIRWSVFLQTAALAIGPVIALIDRNYLKQLGPTPKLVVQDIVILLFLGYLILEISRGRNWARITTFVFFLLGLPFFYFFVKAEYGRSPILSVLSILQTLMQGTGLLITFVSPAKEYFGPKERIYS